MKSFFLIFLLILSCAWGAGEPTQSDNILVRYSFFGLTGGEDELAPELLASGISASSIRRSRGLKSGDQINNSFCASAWTTAKFKNDTDYFQFELIPSGEGISIEAISFSEFSTIKGPEYFTIRSSIDGFKSDIVKPVQRDPIKRGGTHVIQLGAEFKNIKSSVVFRLIAYGAESGNGVWALGSRDEPANLTVLGSVRKK